MEPQKVQQVNIQRTSQKGITLPDTEELNIEPLNEEPTPCDKQRPKKPWEEN